MIRRARLLAAVLLLGAPLLMAQVPAKERIPITDPDRLEALGFPRDATDVSVWSKAELGADRTQKASGAVPHEAATWGGVTGYSTVLGYALQSAEPDIDLYRDTVGSDGALCALGENVGSIPVYANAQIQVPDGASLGFLRFWAYDTADDEDLIFDIYETCQSLQSGSPAKTLIGQTQTFLAIGGYASFTPLNQLAVNNRDCAYSVRVRFAAGGASCRGTLLRVRKLQFAWNRQVSPAPATASFGDVPTSHPFFRFIEALRDSGVTGGCSAAPALYCPEAPITRGQMAVFLATALGLSWP